MILALDPGVSGCGVAVFRGPELLLADYVRNTLASKADDLERCAAMGLAVGNWWLRETLGARLDEFVAEWSLDEFVAEWPRVYQAGRGKRGADPNDLLLLSAVDAAAAVALGCPCRKVEPREHKGTMSEMPDGSYLVETRARKELTTVELARVRLPSAASLGHNVWDSVCVGLWSVGRSLLSRGRVIAR